MSVPGEIPPSFVAAIMAVVGTNETGACDPEQTWRRLDCYHSG